MRLTCYGCAREVGRPRKKRSRSSGTKRSISSRVLCQLSKCTNNSIGPITKAWTISFRMTYSVKKFFGDHCSTGCFCTSYVQQRSVALSWFQPSSQIYLRKLQYWRAGVCISRDICTIALNACENSLAIFHVVKGGSRKLGKGGGGRGGRNQ